VLIWRGAPRISRFRDFGRDFAISTARVGDWEKIEASQRRGARATRRRARSSG